MKRLIGIFAVSAVLSVSAAAQTREYLWPRGKMPDAQRDRQVAVLSDVQKSEGFDPDAYREPYIEWCAKPKRPNGACVIMISGGSYMACCDLKPIANWTRAYTDAGCQCVNLVYRTPRPAGLPIYQSAWEDGQRAVRMVRSEAKKRGFDPDRIGTVSMSAGSHLATLLATSSTVRAYRPVDRLDSIGANVNFAVAHAPAYVTTDGEGGTASCFQGYGEMVGLSSVFAFDSLTCPMCMIQGGNDKYSPNGSTLIYRQLRKMHVPAEVHIVPDKGHGVYTVERGVEFLTQLGMLGPLAPEENLMERFPATDSSETGITQTLWPDGKMPNRQERQCEPYIEWFFPKEKTTDAIQIIYSGGGYDNNSPDGISVAPVRRYLNSKGMTVVTMKYRTPRPEGLPKYLPAWQDLQRAIRLVRSQAADYGLNPDRIGIMGGSAGGHLTLLGATSSLHQTYLKTDDADKLPCNVQWAVAIYPAYVLSDGSDGKNTNAGNGDEDVIMPEFSFDLKTCPTLFIHGDADPYSAMGSVKCWEKMRSIGVQSELHTLATRPHSFQRNTVPGTGSYNYLDRIWDFISDHGFTSCACLKGK